MKKAQHRPITYGLLTLLTVWLWWDYSHAIFAQKNQTLEFKEAHMTLAAQTLSTHTAVPQMDMEAADKFETASFGLG